MSNLSVFNQEQTADLLTSSDLLEKTKAVYKGSVQNNTDKSVILTDNSYIIKQAEKDLIALDAATVIPIKTAAVSMLAVILLQEYEPQHVAVFGTGKQAQAHIKALLDLYENIIIDVIASNPAKSLKFVQEYGDRRVRCTRIVFPEVDLVITATNSKRSVYSLQVDPNRLVIAVGSHDPEHAEIGRNTINNSNIYTDDIELAKSAAGDLIKAEVDWSQVNSIFEVQNQPTKSPCLFKNMGADVWDQAVIECVLNQL